MRKAMKAMRAMKKARSHFGSSACQTFDRRPFVGKSRTFVCNGRDEEGDEGHAGHEEGGGGGRGACGDEGDEGKEVSADSAASGQALTGFVCALNFGSGPSGCFKSLSAWFLPALPREDPG